MHTPGPWRVDPTDRHEVLTADNRFRVLLTTVAAGAVREEWAANARLIAAAPTMRSELEMAADTFRDFSNVLRAIGKDTMAAAADVAERHIREYLASLDGAA